MNYIVFDLEWNQSPGGKKYSNSRLPFEIIEIGAVKMNEQREVVDVFQRLVKPQVYNWIHDSIHEVIHVDYKDLADDPKDEDGFEFSKLENKANKLGLDFIHSWEMECLYVGRPYESIEDNETGKEFKDKAKESIEKLFKKDVKCDFICQEVSY